MYHKGCKTLFSCERDTLLRRIEARFGRNVVAGNLDGHTVSAHDGQAGLHDGQSVV